MPNQRIRTPKQDNRLGTPADSSEQQDTMRHDGPSVEPSSQQLSSNSTTSLAEGIHVYHSEASGLSHGTSLGNARAWVASKGTGEMESLFSVETGTEVTGALTVNYFSSDYDMLYRLNPDESERVTPRTPLPPIQHGDFHFHPAYQQRTMTIVGQVSVIETLFVPRAAGLDEPAAVYHVIRLTNNSGATRRVTVLGALHLPGATPNDIQGRFDRSAGALVAWNESNTRAVRVFGLTPDPDEHALTVDVEQAYYPTGPQDGHAGATGEVIGVLGRTVALESGESARLSFLVVFSPNGQEAALDIYREMADFRKQFVETVAFYRDTLRVSDVRTPDALLNQGAQWSKANMIRVMQRYKTLPSESIVAFTNDPGKGSNIVARDVCWFTMGCDYLMPDVSRGMLDAIALLQEVSGKIIEYWSGRTGRTEDYGLNINDNTPLFAIAAAHHARVTGDLEWARRIYPNVERAVRYALSQRDERGLVWCDATGTGAHGIAGWRNIIDGRTISGAVTEINCECYMALREASSLARIVGEDAAAAEFADEAEKLKIAINRHLKNPNNGLYYLTINVNGQHESTVTADQVFPLMFHVADRQTMSRIMDRLLMPDFNTDAGLRTLSSKNPLYRPDALVGLMGGVWPGLTWWFALGCAHAESEIIVDALVSSYQHYLRNPGTYNTVPGQFSEWFDGETLINRGMRLSPWEPPRYLWATLEGAMGFGQMGGENHLPIPAQQGAGKAAEEVSRFDDPVVISPVVPDAWRWFSVLGVPFREGRISYFACKMAFESPEAPKGLRFFGVGNFDARAPIDRSEHDRTVLLSSHVPDVAACAFTSGEGKAGERVLICLGSISDEARIVLLDTVELFDSNLAYRVRVYASESGEWDDAGVARGQKLDKLATRVEGHGFRLYEFTRA